MIRLGLVHTTDFRELPVGGTLTSLRRFLAHHDRQAFRTDLIGFDFNRAPADDVVTVSDRTFRFVSCGRIRLVDGRRPVVPVRLRSLLAGWFRRGRFRAGGYDVLLVHNVDILFSLAGGVDCPIVLQAHGVLENAARFSRYRFARLRLFQALYRRMVGRVLRRCAFIVSVNEEGRAFYLERYPFLADRLAVVPSMVDLDLFRPDPDGRHRTRATLSIGDIDPVLLFVGRLSEGKNLGFLIRVARRLADRRPNLHLLLCGDGECRPALQAQARDAGLETVVRFMGRLPNERLPEVAAAADVFVLPSLAEGLSVALLEALACGVPAVCSNVGDLAQVVASGENGYVIQDYDVDAYAGRIEDVLRDHARFSRQARESVRRYDAGAITRQFEEILKRVARQSGRPPDADGPHR